MNDYLYMNYGEWIMCLPMIEYNVTKERIFFMFALACGERSRNRIGCGSGLYRNIAVNYNKSHCKVAFVLR